MSDPYERVKGGRLTFKGGSLAGRSKAIDKNKSKKKKKKGFVEAQEEGSLEDNNTKSVEEGSTTTTTGGGEGGEIVYTIDAAKRMKYDQLFPVEAKKFGYDPIPNSKSVEDALDDRVKKKADRYCK